jgi:lipoprotein-anchoring transpeptidase ErfK/SrfK
MCSASARAQPNPKLVYPWSDADEVPLPSWVRSAAPGRGDLPVYQGPGDLAHRRGSLMLEARVPIYGAKRGANCGGRWLEIGPAAWVCSDEVNMVAEAPMPGLALRPMPDGLPYRYYFAGPEGADAYATFNFAGDESPERQLEKGWAVPIVEQRTKNGESWGRTRAGQWIAMRELGAARSFAFHGEELAGALDVAWVVTDRISVFAEATAQKRSTETLVRFQAMRIEEEKTTKEGVFLKVRDSASAAGARGWVRAKDVARPTASAPPAEVAEGERWIDVELSSQTLVAYEGTRPVFATIVSTGRGAQGTETATPKGVHRIWVKLNTTAMDNLEKEDVQHYYSIEDVPWVQFFDKGVALHGAFWHRDFGHVRSHGCVNLAPIDAHRLFVWTAPRLPSGWEAALPSYVEKGSWVRVR